MYARFHGPQRLIALYRVFADLNRTWLSQHAGLNHRSFSKAAAQNHDLNIRLPLVGHVHATFARLMQFVLTPGGYTTVRGDEIRSATRSHLASTAWEYRECDQIFLRDCLDAFVFRVCKQSYRGGG